ncbi:hypothetical protein KDH_27670 [Dictyobacter sp. S3.2.2.5]|uniref:Uncharacterized protein n=1 Tax=Dictyobacter halimunensis TaxID=3026934 RepID=A0ABQ6FTS5_9CHLR|nr:hypothetical protein KDH_27670 [Dictyobacter sp. S3.2.2.5]
MKRVLGATTTYNQIVSLSTSSTLSYAYEGMAYAMFTAFIFFRTDTMIYPYENNVSYEQGVSTRYAQKEEL